MVKRELIQVSQAVLISAGRVRGSDPVWWNAKNPLPGRQAGSGSQRKDRPRLDPTGCMYEVHTSKWNESGSSSQKAGLEGALSLET